MLSSKRGSVHIMRCSCRAGSSDDSRDSHRAPVYMVGQVQEYPGAVLLSVQVPSFRQGLEAQLFVVDVANAQNILILPISLLCRGM